MTKYDKANELLNKLDFEDGKYEITDALVDMYEWTKEQLIEKACKVHCAKFCKIRDRTHCQVCNNLNLIKKTMEE